MVMRGASRCDIEFKIPVSVVYFLSRRVIEQQKVVVEVSRASYAWRKAGIATIRLPTVGKFRESLERKFEKGSETNCVEEEDEIHGTRLRLGKPWAV